jgi:hypothetical protein
MHEVADGGRRQRSIWEISVKGNQYGDWDFTQTNTNAAGAGGRYDSEAKVVFHPKNKCDCDEIAYVQNTRTTDTTTGAYYEPRSNFENRATKNGWTIDRIDQRKYGWYGYNNDGTPAGNVSPGNTNTDATLLDDPGDSAVNQRWEFETCAICKKGKDSGTAYGCITWGFTVDKDGNLTSLKSGFGGGPSKDFNSAVDSWNNQAKGPADKRNDPGQVPLGPFAAP